MVSDLATSECPVSEIKPVSFERVQQWVRMKNCKMKPNRSWSSKQVDIYEHLEGISARSDMMVTKSIGRESQQ